MQTREELVDRLSEERIWRVKEITTITTLASRQSLQPVEVEFYCRAGAALMYSHWEGFVKRAASHYVKHIAFQRLALSEMAEFVLVLYVHQCIGGDLRSNVHQVSALGDKLLRAQGTRPKLRWKGAISTDSNLSSKVFNRILEQIGISQELFTIKAKVIDNLIVKNRNSIAHGEKGDVDVSTLTQISSEVIGLISLFKDTIENAAVLRLYKR